MKIKEIIVVEGKDDTIAIQQAVDADTIETNGSAINDQTIEKIRLAKQTRGVIILTDPDFPGEKIRHTINHLVPGCKNAFIDKSNAIQEHGKGVGVEHASSAVIREALKVAQYLDGDAAEVITHADLIAAGLLGNSRAKERREKLGKLLKIGYANGKQLHKRLKMFRIGKRAFLDALASIETEGEHE
ncbi:ribonuclease M5 [Bacillaceae bacterium Marseille-Q3522]|nr:ribonuclease M5 [Bacillaceae bacterium Marseille-Q3522]